MFLAIYRDVLELKAIQRSLPTAAQPPDPLARRQPAQYLQGVPIGLLPIFDDTHPSVNTVTSSASVIEAPLSPPPELTPVPSRSPAAFSTITTIPHQPVPLNVPSISPLFSAPTTPTTPRRKPNFTFLPLLDTPTAPPPTPLPSSELDTDDSDHESHPSTPSLSTASLDTTPSPREEDTWDPAHGYFQLPPPRIPKPKSPSHIHNPYFPTYEETEQKRSIYTSSPEFLSSPKGKGKGKQYQYQESYDLDINGETIHFGPSSTPPDSPPPRSLSPSLKVTSSPKCKPLKNPSPRKKPSSCGRDMYPPSPILAPYYGSGVVGGKGR